MKLTLIIYLVRDMKLWPFYTYSRNWLSDYYFFYYFLSKKMCLLFKLTSEYEQIAVLPR